MTPRALTQVAQFGCALLRCEAVAMSAPLRCVPRMIQATTPAHKRGRRRCATARLSLRRCQSIMRRMARVRAALLQVRAAPHAR